MNPELAWMVAIFWIGRKPRCKVSMASASQTVRTALEGYCPFALRKRLRLRKIVSTSFRLVKKVPINSLPS